MILQKVKWLWLTSEYQLLFWLSLMLQVDGWSQGLSCVNPWEIVHERNFCRAFSTRIFHKVKNDSDSFLSATFQLKNKCFYKFSFTYLIYMFSSFFFLSEQKCYAKFMWIAVLFVMYNLLEFLRKLFFHKRWDSQRE